MQTDNLTILIVEDDYNHKIALKNCLKSLGYHKVFEARNSQEAIELCESNKFQVAILDIGLVDSTLDGIELGKELNRITEASIIFTTSFSDHTTLTRSAEVDHQTYLSKPIRERDLKVALHKAVMAKSNSSSATKSSLKEANLQECRDDIYIKGADKFYKRILVDDIIYIKADTGGVNVVTLNNGKLFVYTTLSSFLRQYPHPDIIRVHKGHAVNKSKINSKSESIINMINGKELAIGAKWRDALDSQIFILKS